MAQPRLQIIPSCNQKAKFSEALVQRAEVLIANGTTSREVKAGLSVMLATKVGLADAEIAELLGVGTATLSRLRSEVREVAGGQSHEQRPWGGRRHETLSVEEEAGFLAPWVDKAAQGGVLVVPPLQVALEERVGHPVAKSTVYRMLARHGWRKIAPDNAHPKRDADAQEAFKKKAYRWRWQKP